VTFKIDENIPLGAADLLRQAGHGVETVGDEGLIGADDSIIAARARDEARAIITMDMGFSDIRAYPPTDYAGIVVIRSKRQDERTVLDLVRRFIPLLDAHPLYGTIWIVEHDRVRIR